MFAFLRSPKRDVLTEPQRLSTADYLCRLMEEQNQLLRELLGALGRQSSIPRANPAVNVRRQYTDKDVFRVSREQTEERLQKERDQREHPWRGQAGQDNPPTTETGGALPLGNVEGVLPRG